MSSVVFHRSSGVPAPSSNLPNPNLIDNSHHETTLTRTWAVSRISLALAERLVVFPSDQTSTCVSIRHLMNSGIPHQTFPSHHETLWSFYLPGVLISFSSAFLPV